MSKKPERHGTWLGVQATHVLSQSDLSLLNRGNQRKPIYLSDDDFLIMLDTLANAVT